LVADGVKEEVALLEAGYSEKSKLQIIKTLRRNKRMSDKIRQLKGLREMKPIADREDREKLWTLIMNDPTYPAGVRLEASKLLGKAQGDFTISKKIEHSVGNPVVKMPNSSPEEWERYWEKTNK
jgi:hypothetical protein